MKLQLPFSTFTFFLLISCTQILSDNSAKVLPLQGTQEKQEHALNPNDFVYNVRSNKATYKIGEPIFLQFQLQNQTDKEITVNSEELTCFTFDSVKLNVSPTFRKVNLRDGTLETLDIPEKEVSLSEYGKNHGKIKKLLDRYSCEADPRNTTLAFGENMTVLSKYVLNVYFDVTLPGKYQAVFTFPCVLLEEDVNPKQVKSNILTFEVVDTTYYSQSDLELSYNFVNSFVSPSNTIRFKIEGYPNWLDNQVVWPEDAK